MFTHDDIKALARDLFGTEPDHPFADDGFTYTLRQPDHGKWYAVGMRVKREVIGLPGDGLVDIVNVKADPNKVPSLTKKLGIPLSVKLLPNLKFGGLRSLYGLFKQVQEPSCQPNSV